MASISIAAYSIQVRLKRSDEFLVLGSFNGSKSFGDVVDEFLSYLSKDHAHDTATQSLQRAEDVIREKDVRSGILHAGEYGYGADLIEIGSGAKNYERQADEAEVYPFYFLMSISPSRKRGIMLFQRHGAKGIFTSFSNEFRKWFEANYSDYTLEMKRLVPREVMNYLLKGRLKTIEITTLSVPQDQADKIPHFGNIQDVGEFTVSFTAKKNKFLSKPGWIRKVIGGDAKIIEVPDSLGKLGDRVRVSVDYEGRTRKVDFGRPESIAPYIDCTNDIKLGENGHPTRESMHAYATELLGDLIKQIGH